MSDRNYQRLLMAIDSFRARHRKWPMRARMLPVQINEIRGLLSSTGWEKLAARIQLVASEEAAFLVEDDEGRTHDYMNEGVADEAPNIRAEDWLEHPEWRKPSDEAVEAYHRRDEELREQFPGADFYLIGD